MNRFFTVCFDKEGNIESSSTDSVASISETDAREYALKVYKNDSDSGYIDEYRYRMQKVDDSTIIVFLNVSREQQYMKSLRNLSLVVAMGSLTLVFILIMIFSKSVVIPIEKNINMQKRFITDASHELKTPLTSISTSLDVITMVHGEDEWTENIKNQTNRMSKLVSELVTLSKLDEELPLPNKEKFSLSSAAWEIIGIYEQQAKGKNKKLTLDIAEDVSMVGEKASIQQMLSVLIDNAIRYSDDNGEIKLSIYKKRKKVVIEVFNTCQLEKVPDVKRLFDRFYRPDDSRNIKTGGNGIGLAIAKAVAETHGGTIEALCPDGKTMTMKVVI
jgi:signal transduction histidine kinase